MMLEEIFVDVTVKGVVYGMVFFGIIMICILLVYRKNISLYMEKTYMEMKKSETEFLKDFISKGTMKKEVKEPVKEKEPEKVEEIKFIEKEEKDDGLDI